MPAGDLYLGDSKIGGGEPAPEPDPPPYVRPADWLPLPEVLPGQQKLVGLVAVHDTNSNLVGFTMAGAYTVDWGDGSAPQNVATGALASHAYKWSDIPASTLTSDGYRQAIITVTPQGAANFTTVTLAMKHTSARSGQTTKWLDVKLAAPNMTALTVSSTSYPARMLEQFEFVGTAAPGLTSLASAFRFAVSFQSLIGGRALSANVTNFGTYGNGMFDTCLSMTTAPDLDTSKGTSFASMFAYCGRLQKVPDYDLRKGTTFQSMFYLCANLRFVPDFDVRAGVTFTTMFQGCATLQRYPALMFGTGALSLGSLFHGCYMARSLPLLNFSSATTLTNTFFRNSALRGVPAFDLGKATTVASMFNDCRAVKQFPDFDAPLCTDFSDTFRTCGALRVAPNITMGTGAISLLSMFAGCYSLIIVPAYTTATATNFNAMFNITPSLVVIPALNMSSVSSTANVAGFLTDADSTERILAFGLRFGGFAVDCGLAGPQLDEFYTNLGTASGAQTITVTNNWGTATDNPSIATAKGWTVTG